MILSVIATVFSIALIGVDWYCSSQLENAASQLEALLSAIQYGSTFEEFVSQCWMFILLGSAFVWMLAALAFPKPKKEVY